MTRDEPHYHEATIVAPSDYIIHENMLAWYRTRVPVTTKGHRTVTKVPNFEFERKTDLFTEEGATPPQRCYCRWAKSLVEI
jgi:hypothetical protein